MFRILALNLGSTSTKLAVYDGETPVLEQVLRHSAEEMAGVSDMAANAAFRKPLIMDFLQKSGVDIRSLNAVVGRGGMMRPIPSGVYAVNARMLADLNSCAYGNHASNLGGILADDIASELGVPAFIADPTVVDELQDVARLSGNPAIPRRSVFHALNQKAIARRYAAECGKTYEEMNLIVAHLGGGATVGAHCKGRVIDVNNGLDGEGPFSAERPGGLPVIGLLNAFQDSALGDLEQTRRALLSRSGLVAYLGTNDGREVVARIEAGDKEAELAYRAMAYQISKEVGAMAVVLRGKVDAILMTGGFAYDKLLMSWIEEQVSFLAPVKIYPGEDELGALVQGALRVLRGQEAAKEY